MEEAVSEVITKLGQTEKSIEDIDNRLEEKFSYLLDGEGTSRNAVAVQELNEIKREFASVQKEALEIGRLQKEMIVAFQQGISETISALQGLTNLPSKDTQTEGSTRHPQELIGSLISQSEVAERLTEKLKGTSAS